MLRELNENEMMMVSGGNPPGQPEPRLPPGTEAPTIHGDGGENPLEGWDHSQATVELRFGDGTTIYRVGDNLYGDFDGDGTVDGRVDEVTTIDQGHYPFGRDERTTTYWGDNNGDGVFETNIRSVVTTHPRSTY